MRVIYNCSLYCIGHVFKVLLLSGQYVTVVYIVYVSRLHWYGGKIP